VEQLERNRLFEAKAYLIDRTLRRHRLLLQYCRMDPKDVYQELSISLLTALERYDPVRCPNLDAWLTLRLRYGLLDQRPASKRYGIPMAPRSGISVISLDEPDLFGNAREIPASDMHGNPLWIEREIERLPTPQKDVINKLLSGKIVHHNNKNLMAARYRIKKCSEHRREEEIWGGVHA
jgi:DNA-directed RNA polymerase specialized sigma24 family protein